MDIYKIEKAVVYILIDSKNTDYFRMWGFEMTEEVKSSHLKLRIPQEKKEQIRKYAYLKGLSMSSYIRYVLSEDIEKQLVQDEKTILNTGGNEDV